MTVTRTRGRGARGGGVARVGVPGIVMMLAGVALVLVSFTALDWYEGSAGADAVHGIGFTDLHRNLDALSAPVATRAYFAWLAWVLVLALIVTGLLANLPATGRAGARMTGLALGLAGAGFTYYALAEYVRALHDLGADRGGVLDHAQAGIWLALGGYLLAGVGALVGPLPAKRRPRPV